MPVSRRTAPVTILGENLLLRTRGHFGGLTEEGSRFLTRARQVLGAVESACRSISRTALFGRVRIGVMDDFDIPRLLDLIAHFEDRYPGVETVTVSDLSTRLEEKLARGEIDLAVTRRLLTSDRAASSRAMRIDRLRWVTGEGFAWSGEGRLPVVVFPEGCIFRTRLFEALMRLGVEWTISYSGHSYANIRAAVAAGLGVSALPDDHVATDHVRWDPELVGLVPIDLGFVELGVRVAGERLDPVVAAFRREIEDRLNGDSQDLIGQEAPRRSSRRG